MSALANEMFDDSTRQTLCSLAFYALNQGQGKQAEQLFEMLKVVKPESPLPYIGLANYQLQQANHTQAVALLREQALPRSDEGPVISLTTAYLGLALCMKGDVQASEDCFERVLAADDNPSAVTLVGKVRTLFGTGPKTAAAPTPIANSAAVSAAHAARV